MGRLALSASSERWGAVDGNQLLAAERQTMSLTEHFQLRRVLGEQEALLLLALLDEYGQRWRHSATQIWSIGVIFIPLSLSGVVITTGNTIRSYGIAVFSVVLIWIWYWISQSIRSRLDQDWSVYAAIESSLLKLEPPRLKRGLVELAPRTNYLFSIRKLRLMIAIVITLAWLLLTVSHR
jgi:hypothetical protein